MWTKLWLFWKKFARGLAIIQTTIILTLFYFLIIGIFSIIIKLFRKDLLDKKWKKNKSFWMEKEKVSIDMESAKRQF